MFKYPEGFKHVEREWWTEAHYHWIENFMDEGTGEVIQVERCWDLVTMIEQNVVPLFMLN